METLIGLTYAQWMNLLRENQFRIHPSRSGKAALLTALTLRNSYFARQEEQQYGAAIEAATIEHPPVFILGHWRSGTTLLHNIISLDKQWAYPNLLEIYNPFTFLVVEARLKKQRDLNKERKRPMDNVTVSALSPGEEEFAISMLSLKSPLLAWNFPRNEEYYDRYLTFEEATAEDIASWKAAYQYFLKKLTLQYPGKPLLLKSPPNTARIRLLLDMFPEAKFVHIHRNPIHVFQSTMRLYHKTVRRFTLQKPFTEEEQVEGIIRRYQLMYRAYFRDIQQIPSGNFIEIAFEELEQDFYRTVEKIYLSLNLEGVEAFSPILKKKSEELRQYRKNKYPSIHPEHVERLYNACPSCFETWQYDPTMAGMVNPEVNDPL